LRIERIQKKKKRRAQRGKGDVALGEGKKELNVNRRGRGLIRRTGRSKEARTRRKTNAAIRREKEIDRREREVAESLLPEIETGFQGSAGVPGKKGRPLTSQKIAF